MENAPVKTEMKTGGAVMAFVPQNYDEAWRLAKTVIAADMAPNGLKSPEKVMVAIMHGQEVGLTPMAALQSIAVINGRPTIWGDGALGLVQGSGKLEWIRETISGDDDARTATCAVKRFNDAEVKTATFSVKDAKAAGLWKKAGPWTQYPDRMLKMRARSWALRDGFSDVLRGLSVTEEVQDIPQAPEKTEHTIVGSEPLTGTAAPVSELRMPSVKAAVADAASAEEPAEVIEHSPGVEYLDEITEVTEIMHQGKPYYGIKTKAHGKKSIGTINTEFAERARAAIDGDKIEIVYAENDKKQMSLVRIGPAVEQAEA